MAKHYERFDRSEPKDGTASHDASDPRKKPPSIVPFDVEVYQHRQQHYSRHPYDYYGRIEEPEVTEADDEHGKEYTKQGQDVPREAWQELAS
ncbi:hypothetical protein E4U14_008186 [Claviceps sp. LM454 group G7]|nr:hypothetical protein E4U14_008186 [Claviceps sp. LM454 group G7]